MSDTSQPSEWSAPHDVALLFLALIHGTDLDIDPAEQSTLVEKLHDQFPDAQDTHLRQVFDEVMLTYLGGHSHDMVEAAIASLKESMNKNERVSLLNDLADLASADGSIVPGEVAFIQQLARFWEVDRVDN